MLKEQKEVLEQNGIDKIFFYYEGSPIAKNIHTTCLLINTKEQRIEARGVSICSLLDTFSRKKGKDKSSGRALKALLNKQNFHRINGEGREGEKVIKIITIKNKADHENFLNNQVPELSLLNQQISDIEPITRNGKYIKKYKFALPANYPIKRTNESFKYKSEFRPTPVNEIESKVLLRNKNNSR